MACIYGIEQNCNECRMCAYEKMTNRKFLQKMSNKEIAEKIYNFGCKLCEYVIGKCPNDGDGDYEESIEKWMECERDD